MSFALNLEKEEINILAGCLAEQPFKIVAPLMDKIGAQLKEQGFGAETKAAELPKE